METKPKIEKTNGDLARVIFEAKGAYRVRNERGEFLAKITGKQMFTARSREDYPAVGDWVEITDLGQGQAVIKRVLPRQSVIKRRAGDRNKFGEKTGTQIIATNIDVAFVVEAVGRDYNLNRYERYLTLVEAGSSVRRGELTTGAITPVIILNKIDLLGPAERAEKWAELKRRFPDLDLIFTSTESNEGLAELKKYLIRGQTYCFLGSSGVGKSSIINKLLGDDAGEEVIATEAVSAVSGRGRHTTTARQMYFLAGGAMVIDNPGLREIGLVDAGEGVDQFFDEITALARACRYADCTHTHEIGCEVIGAVESGRLSREQYANYLTLKKETEYEEMSAVEKRGKERRFGKFLKQAKRDLKNFGHKY